MTAAATLMTAMRPAICEVRIGKPEDLAFVVEVWVDRLQRRNKHTRASVLRSHVRSLLARETSRLIVAHVPREADAILGWAATELGYVVDRRDDDHRVVDRRLHPPCVHYVYVRSDARMQGIARCMLTAMDRYVEAMRGDAERTEYSIAAPKAIALPDDWDLNTDRARTRA